MGVVGKGCLCGPRVGIGVGVFRAAFAGALLNEAAAATRSIKFGGLFDNGWSFDRVQNSSELARIAWVVVVACVYEGRV